MIVSSVSASKMDEADAVSLASIKMKDECRNVNTAYSLTSEAPPIYKERVNTSVRIARLIAATVVAVALILGAAIILAAYLQTRVQVTESTPVSNRFLRIPYLSAIPGNDCMMNAIISSIIIRDWDQLIA